MVKLMMKGTRGKPGTTVGVGEKHTELLDSLGTWVSSSTTELSQGREQIQHDLLYIKHEWDFSMGFSTSHRLITSDPMLRKCKGVSLFSEFSVNQIYFSATPISIN